MDSPAERSSFKRWLIPIIVGTLLLLVIQTLLMGPARGEPISWRLIADVVASVIPNFIAGLVAALTLYLVVRTDDRANYVSAMRSLRTSVSTLLDSGKIQPEDVQTLMKTFVPTVSNLYFKSELPQVRAEDKDKTYSKLQCFSCRKPSDVIHGRCFECKDILDSWRTEERSQLTATD
jgi:hypothetical protein